MTRFLKLTFAAAAAWAVALAPLSAGAKESSDSPTTFSVKGLIDARLALTDDTRGWQDRGLGKTRYGGDAGGQSRVIARMAEASLVVQTRLTWDLTAVALVTANARQQHGIEPIEAFLSYKPAPTSAFSFRAKAGAFFPSISLENTNLAWTSPYTISSSAINTWIGEELRTIGVEGSVVFHGENGLEASLSAAGFGLNDPAGSVLAWRGWSIHDREPGLTDQLPLPRLSNFLPGGSAAGQADNVEPFEEVDDRLGFYASANVTIEDDLRFKLLFYDNNADDLNFNGRQYAWNTRFGAVSASAQVGENWDVVAQAMTGNTTMATFPAFSVVDNNFSSAFVLISREWNQHRLSARLETFDVHDRDRTPDDPNAEHGQALTLAYVFRPSATQRLTFEALHVSSNRARRLDFGLPVRARETQLQLSYRLFFSTN